MKREEQENFIKALLKNWEDRNEDLLSNMYSKAVVGYMDDKVVHYDDIMNRLQFSKKNFKKVTNEIKDLMVDGEKVIARIKQTMIGRADDKPTIYQIIAIYRVVANQVVETWSSFYPNVNYLKND